MIPMKACRRLARKYRLAIKSSNLMSDECELELTLRIIAGELTPLKRLTWRAGSGSR